MPLHSPPLPFTLVARTSVPKRSHAPQNNKKMRQLFGLLLLLLLLSRANCNVCHDDQGRPGHVTVRSSSCANGMCTADAVYSCHLDELEPRAVGSTWECDAGYTLVGARVTWPDGVMVARPDKCTPEGGRAAPMRLRLTSLFKGEVSP